jgi:hypothetical protein
MRHVDVLPPERVQLAGAGTGVRRGEDKAAVAVRYLSGERPHLAVGKVQLLLRADRRQAPQPSTRVGSHETEFDRFGAD